MIGKNMIKKLTLEVFVDDKKQDADFCLMELLDDIADHDFVQDDTIKIFVNK